MNKATHVTPRDRGDRGVEAIDGDIRTLSAIELDAVAGGNIWNVVSKAATTAVQQQSISNEFYGPYQGM